MSETKLEILRWYGDMSVHGRVVIISLPFETCAIAEEAAKMIKKYSKEFTLIVHF